MACIYTKQFSSGYLIEWKTKKEKTIPGGRFAGHSFPIDSGVIEADSEKEAFEKAEDIVKDHDKTAEVYKRVSGRIGKTLVKTFSNTPTTAENSSKVVGQIIKSEGKTFFQIIAMTDDMELAGKTKNTLLKMGYEDSKDEVKQFGKSVLFYVTKENDTQFWSFDNDWTQRMDEADAWSDKADAEKIAKKVGGEVKQFSKESDLQELAEELVALLHKADKDGVVLTKEEVSKINELVEKVKTLGHRASAMQVIDELGLNNFGY